MVAQQPVHASLTCQVPSRFNPNRQIAGRARFAASCALLAVAALGGCATDEQDLDLAACDAPEVYRIDRIELPRNNLEAAKLGLDLDAEDGATDNQLGLVSSMLHSQLGPLDVAAVMSTRLAGEVSWSLAVRACGERVAVSVGRGDGLDTVQLVGPAGAGTLEARGAGGELPLSLMFDPAAAVADPGWLPGALGAIELERSADGARFSAKLGLAIADASAFEAIVPPLARFFDAHLEDSSYLTEHFDRNDDGTITEQELRESTVFRSLFAPDLDVGGAPALSVGIGLSGVRAP